MPLRSIVRRDILSRGAAAALALVLESLAVAPAQAVHVDTQIWNTQNSNYEIDDKWSTNLEVQERWYGDVSYFAIVIVRPSSTYKWNDWLSLTGGYAQFRVWDPDGDFADEDRIWEQVIILLFGGKDQPTLNWRMRPEQRIFEAGGVQGVAWTVPFWRLNDVVQANGRLQESGIELRLQFAASILN
jgi:hypothetical protein